MTKGTISMDTTLEEKTEEKTTDIDLSWANDLEMPILADIERDMTAMKVKILDVKRNLDVAVGFGELLVKLDITVSAPVKDGKRIVERKFRLLWPDATWKEADPKHTACNGRGYMIMKTGARGVAPVELEDGKTEGRASCPCASARYRRKHAEVLFENGYGFVPLDGFVPLGGEAPGAAAPSPEVSIYEDKEATVTAEKLKVEARIGKQIADLKNEAEAQDEISKAFGVEVDGIMAERQIEIDRLQAIIDREYRPRLDVIAASLEEAGGKANVAAERLAEVEDLLEKAKETVRTLAREHQVLVTESAVEFADLDKKTKAIQLQIERVPVPGRLGRLRREMHIAKKRAADLRERIVKKERELGEKLS